jgi:hypothetical protein
MNGEPGFTKYALTALKAKVIAVKRDNQEVVCALMLDEMAIRKHVEWNGKQFRGYVDLGTGINDDSLPEATDALVFMAVSVNSGWKVPCGYFLVKGLTGEEKVNLTKECITKLHDRNGGEGGVFYVRWPHISPGDVEIAWRSTVTWQLTSVLPTSM